MQSQENQNSNRDLKASRPQELSDCKRSQDRLDELLAGCFTLQKMYGRAPDSMETVTSLFHTLLGKYPAGKVIRSFEAWLERSQEFPTPADIIGFIKRNGKPPLSREMYIGISKKEAEDRTAADWQYMRDYDAGQRGDEWDSEYVDEKKNNATLEENIRLRQKVKDLESENRRAWDEVKKERQASGITVVVDEAGDKVQRTIEAMKAMGANPADIREFAEQQGIAA